MKKTLLLLVALLAVMTVQAQSICATWRSLQPVVETDVDGSFTAQHYTYTFYNDGTYSFIDEMTLASEPAQTMAQEVATNIIVKGTYVLEGDKLTLRPDMGTYKTELISISQNGRVTKNANVKTTVNAKLNSKDFKTKFAEVQNFTVKVGNNLLEMKKGNKTFNYARIATITD